MHSETVSVASGDDYGIGGAQTAAICPFLFVHHHTTSTTLYLPDCSVVARRLDLAILDHFIEELLPTNVLIAGRVRTLLL